MPEDNNSTDTNNQNNTDNQNNNLSQSNNASKYSGGGKTICLGADSGCQQEDCTKIQKTLESCGNTVKFTMIDPNQEDHMKGSGADFNVFFCNGVPAATVWSFRDAIKAGSLPFTIFAFITGPPYHDPNEPNGELASMENIRKVPFEPEHDAGQFMTGDSTSAMASEKQGDGTLGAWVDANSQYVSLCSGNTAEELGQNICSGACGGGSGGGTTTSTGGGAQVKDKTFEHCIKRICAATDSVFLVENNAAVLFPYTDWMAFTLRQQINTISASQMDPDLFEIDYNNEGFYNKVTTVWGADEESEEIKTNDKENEEEKKKVGNTTTIQKQMPTGGTKLSEQYDPLVDIYGELEKKVTTNFPNEETAHYVMNSLLIQYIRDFNNSCKVRAINNQKFIGGTFYAVENPFTKKSELFYLNSYTVFKNKDQPITMDLEFKYGPEGAEEILDYQAYGGGGGGGQTQSFGSATEDQIWKHAANFCHFWSCPELQEEESETEDPQTAENYVNKKEKEGKTKIGLSCYGMSSWLYFQFNYKANIPCHVIGNSGHHVVEIYKNNQWYKPIEEYRQLDEGFRYDDFCKGNAPVLLEAKNPPSGSTSNANSSGNTTNQ